MNTIASHHRARVRPLSGLLIGLVAGCLVASCSVATASPSPTTGAPPSPSPIVPTQVPATPTPSPTPTSLPSADTAPSGQWSGIRWISAGPVFPQTPTADPSSGLVAGVSVFGWSHGYVGFRAMANMNSTKFMPATLFSTSSTDGLHWTAVRPLDTEGAPYLGQRTQVVEGPAGLLAVSWNAVGVCGGPATVGAFWTSPDGITWSRVALPTDFSSASVYTVDAGSTGYIATGTLKDGVTQAVWLSRDGRSWRQVPLPKPTSGAVVVDGATDFAGGYVLSGAERIDLGCGESAFTPSLWWSADGGSWTRSKLSGAQPTGSASVTVNRISDHSLLAIATEWNQTTQLSSQLVWFTTDGRTWNLAQSPSNLLTSSVLTNGQRGLVLAASGDGGLPTIATVGDDLAVTTLAQSGDSPIASSSSVLWMAAAFGPTGIVVLSADGLSLWLGVPTAS